jgi:hypothetical protein
MNLYGCEPLDLKQNGKQPHRITQPWAPRLLIRQNWQAKLRPGNKLSKLDNYREAIITKNNIRGGILLQKRNSDAGDVTS